ncbi:uncharacterized protein LOC108023165 [Drosophila biarmipes]|uniref:uncharacterized protein LOC108023165 n=1 Tax=Drosophila biarmipes TaxID=125945 RepID=UPI0021CCB447|nr:uncharacterized protein LOC108023165 [Drosophila biarmipes]
MSESENLGIKYIKDGMSEEKGNTVVKTREEPKRSPKKSPGGKAEPGKNENEIGRKRSRKMCDEGEILDAKKTKGDELEEKQNKVVKTHQEPGPSPKKSTAGNCEPGKDEKQSRSSGSRKPSGQKVQPDKDEYEISSRSSTKMWEKGDTDNMLREKDNTAEESHEELKRLPKKSSGEKLEPAKNGIEIASGSSTKICRKGGKLNIKGVAYGEQNKDVKTHQEPKRSPKKSSCGNAERQSHRFRGRSQSSSLKKPTAEKVEPGKNENEIKSKSSTKVSEKGAKDKIHQELKRSPMKSSGGNVEKHNTRSRGSSTSSSSSQSSGEEVDLGRDKKQNISTRGQSTSSRSSSSGASSGSSSRSSSGSSSESNSPSSGGSKSSSSGSESGSVTSSPSTKKKKTSASVSFSQSSEQIPNSSVSVPPKNRRKSRSRNRSSRSSRSRPKRDPVGNPRVVPSPSTSTSSQHLCRPWWSRSRARRSSLGSRSSRDSLRSRSCTEHRHDSGSPIGSRSPPRIVECFTNMTRAIKRRDISSPLIMRVPQRSLESRACSGDRQEIHSPLKSRSPQPIFRPGRSRMPSDNRQTSRSLVRSRSPQGISDPGRSRMPSDNRQKSRSPLRSKMENRQKSRSPLRSRMENRQKSRSPLRSRMATENRQKSRSPLRSRMENRQRSRSALRSRVATENRENTRSPLKSRMATKNRQKSRSPLRSRKENRQRSRSPLRSMMENRQKSRSPLRSRMENRQKSRSPLRSRMENREKGRSPLRSTVATENVEKSHSSLRSRMERRQKSRSPLRSSVEYPRKSRSPLRSRMATENGQKSRSQLRSRICNPWKQIPTPTDREQNESELYRERHKITLASCDPRPAPKPVQNFHHSGFGEDIVRRLELHGFEAPTPIQAQTWPVAQSGGNLVMVSGTGTGKTLGYLLPGIVKVQKKNLSQRRHDGPIVLVLVDCREAAILVHKEAQSLTDQRELRSQCISGSSWWNATTDCELLVATAGRFLEIMSNDGQKMALGRCSYVVFDDVDRMMDVGLEGQLCRLLCQMRPQAQFVISSSSWTRNLQRMARKYMGDYTLVRVGGPIDSSKSLLSLRQRVVVLNTSRKKDQLKEELTAIYDLSDNPGKVVVYAERQRCVDELVAFLRVFVPCAGLHGGRSVAERDAIIRAFRKGHYNIIVVTDMTQRGLDVPGIQHVINYDFPNSVEAYVQRLTRAGCLSGSQGCEVISLFTKANHKLSTALVAFLEEHKQEVEPRLRWMAKDRVRRIQNRRSDRQRRGNQGQRHY